MPALLGNFFSSLLVKMFYIPTVFHQIVIFKTQQISFELKQTIMMLHMT